MSDQQTQPAEPDDSAPDDLQPDPEGGEQNADYDVTDQSEEGADDDTTAVG